MQRAIAMKGLGLMVVIAAACAALALHLPATAWAEQSDLAIGAMAAKSSTAADTAADDESTPAFVRSTEKLKVDKSKGWLVDNGTYYFALATDATKVLGPKAFIEDKTGAKNQAWKFKFDYNSQCYTITNAKTGKALTVAKAAKRGSKLREAKLIKTSQRLTKLKAIPSFEVPLPNQRWKLKSSKNGYYLVSAANENMIVDFSGDRAKLVKKKTPSVLFWLIGRKGTFEDNGIGNGTYTLKSQSKNALLNIFKSKVKKGTAAQLGAAKTLWGEMFKFEYVKDGYYKIVNFNSGMALTSRSAKKVYQAKYGIKTKPYQLWKPTVVGDDGAVQLVNKGTGLALAARGSKVTVVKPSVSDANQKWLLNPTTTGLTTIGEEALHRANKYSSQTKYAIVIDMTAHEYFLFRKAKAAQSGAPWVLDDTCRCSTGGREKMTNASNGVLGNRAAPPYGRVPDVPAKYCIWAGGTGWLHSLVTYGPQGENQLGWYVSQGCIRLPYENAEYIYKLNVPGTRFIRYYV